MIYKMCFINQARSRTNSLMSAYSHTWVRNGWETASVPVIAMGKQCSGVPYPFLYISIHIPDATFTNTDFVQVTNPLCVPAASSARWWLCLPHSATEGLKCLINVRFLEQGLAHSKYTRKIFYYCYHFYYNKKDKDKNFWSRKLIWKNIRTDPGAFT